MHLRPAGDYHKAITQKSKESFDTTLNTAERNMNSASPLVHRYWGQRIAVAGLNANKGHCGYEAKITVFEPLKEIISAEMEKR